MNLNGTRRIRANRRGGSSDPTRTTTLQNQFIRATNKRLNLIQKVLIESIKTNNAFGLKTNVEPGDQLVLSPYQFANLSDSQKLDTYDAYIAAVIGALFMTDTATGQPYTDKWSTEAFVRGQERANAEWIKAGGVGAPVQAGAPLSLRTPLTDQINMANKRAKTAMDGDAVKLQNRLSYAFGAALTGNMTTAQAATGIREAVAVAKRQTKVTAKTEVVRSFNMGNVAQLETLGVEEVQVVAEWVTAGDRRVCPACRDMEGKVFPIDVIRELIPLHPGCRCVAVPELNPRAKTTTKIPESAEKLLPNSAKPCGCGHHEEPEPVVGETGMRGPRGFDGMKGNTGDRGPRGFDGMRGSDGKDGEKGEIGDKGDKGDKGETGERGPRGYDGGIGPRGERGERGEVGPIGNAGKDGRRGKVGPRGMRGKKGEPGIRGTRGPVPDHELRTNADGTQEIRFQKPKGGYGEWLSMTANKVVSMPSGVEAYEYNGGQLRFKTGGKWQPWIVVGGGGGGGGRVGGSVSVAKDGHVIIDTASELDFIGGKIEEDGNKATIVYGNFFKIEEDQSLTIPKNVQSIIVGDRTVEGELIVTGEIAEI